MPSSVRGYIKFELTCKKEFKDNTEFTDLKKKADLIVEEARIALRDTIVSVQKMEETVQKTFSLKSLSMAFWILLKSVHYTPEPLSKK